MEKNIKYSKNPKNIKFLKIMEYIKEHEPEKYIFLLRLYFKKDVTNQYNKKNFFIRRHRHLFTTITKLNKRVFYNQKKLKFLNSKKLLNVSTLTYHSPKYKKTILIKSVKYLNIHLFTSTNKYLKYYNNLFKFKKVNKYFTYYTNFKLSSLITFNFFNAHFAKFERCYYQKTLNFNHRYTAFFVNLFTFTIDNFNLFYNFNQTLNSLTSKKEDLITSLISHLFDTQEIKIQGFWTCINFSTFTYTKKLWRCFKSKEIKSYLYLPRHINVFFLNEFLFFNDSISNYKKFIKSKFSLFFKRYSSFNRWSFYSNQAKKEIKGNTIWSENCNYKFFNIIPELLFKFVEKAIFSRKFYSPWYLIILIVKLVDNFNFKEDWWYTYCYITSSYKSKFVWRQRLNRLLNKKNFNFYTYKYRRSPKNTYNLISTFYNKFNIIKYSLNRDTVWKIKKPVSLSLVYFLKKFRKHYWIYSINYYFKRKFIKNFYLFYLTKYNLKFCYKLYVLTNPRFFYIKRFITFNAVVLSPFFSKYKEINFKIKHVTILNSILNDVTNMKYSFLSKYASSMMKSMYKHN